MRQIIELPDELHSATKALVVDFAQELARKLRSAEEKYGYSDGWLTENWQSKCEESLLLHLIKGDPRDVAIYAAFMWKRGWATRLPYRLTEALRQLGGALGFAVELRQPPRTYPRPVPTYPDNGR